MKTITKPASTHKSARRQADGPDSDGRADSAHPRLLTLSEAALHLGHVHRTTIMRWVREGRLRCIRLSRKAILFEQTELDRFVREHRYSG